MLNNEKLILQKNNKKFEARGTVFTTPTIIEANKGFKESFDTGPL